MTVVKNLLNRLEVTTLLFDSTLRLRYFSPGKHERKIPLLGQDLNRYLSEFPDPLFQEAEANVTRALAGGTFEKSWQIADGAWFTLRMRPFAIEGDSAPGVMVTFADITVFQTVEEELRQARKELEERIKTFSTETEKAFAAHAKTPVSVLPGGANALVLLVDDDPNTCLIIGEFLKSLDYRVVTAEDALTAIQRVREQEFACILMDVDMPLMNGLEATRTIRQLTDLDEHGRPKNQVPIIALTSHAMKQDQERCLEAGMTGFLAKPASRQQLGETLGRLLKARNLPTP